MNYDMLEKKILNKPFRISRAAYLQYTSSVKGNDGITKEEAAKKLNRNILLSNPEGFYEDEGIQNYIYGRLKIRVDPKSHRIMAVKNLHGGILQRKWKKNDAKYEELNRKLKIVPDELIVNVV